MVSFEDYCKKQGWDPNYRNIDSKESPEVNCVIISKDGLYYRHEGYIVKPLEYTIFQCWNNAVELDNVNLGDLLLHISKLDEYELKLMQHLCDSQINNFLEEGVKLTEAEKVDLDYIKVQRCISLNLITVDNLGIYDMVVDVSGITEGDPNYYALEFIPLTELKNVDLRINNIVKVHDWETDERKEYNASISLGEFLYAIFDEICFCGTIENRDRMSNYLDEMGEKIDDIDLED
ncbi:hypothetical protein ACFL1H_02080 [Nanoarchaeota archaeon]